jgi:hypothetical protein
MQNGSGARALQLLKPPQRSSLPHQSLKFTPIHVQATFVAKVEIPVERLKSACKHAELR